MKEFGEPRPYPFSGEKMFVEAPPAELRRRYAYDRSIDCAGVTRVD